MTVALVGGALANKPGNGGEAWVRLSWVRGLERLGFDAYLVEQIDPASCTDAEGAPAPLDESVNRAFFDSVTGGFGLTGRAALCGPNGTAPIGMSRSELSDLSRDAELLVNISGNVTLPTFMKRVPRRAYIDLDPGFTQFWAAQGVDGARLEDHDAFFTVGERIGRDGCPIPTLGLPWQPLRQPVVLDDWPVSPAGSCGRLTTVASWRGAFGPVEHDGVTFGVKAHEFRRFLPLPERVTPQLEIALAIHAGDARDLEALERHGWRIVDPADAAPDPHRFRTYVASSDGEFSVAQGIYVDTRSGWFSDRSVRYLASGKPVLLQDTGFGEGLPVGDGLLSFSTLAEAAEGARRISDDYEGHARAAREIAERFFDSDLVIGELLERMRVSP